MKTRTKPTPDTIAKVLTILTILTFPIIGTVLILNQDMLGIELVVAGVLCVFLIPLMISYNIVRYRGI